MNISILLLTTCCILPLGSCGQTNLNCSEILNRELVSLSKSNLSIEEKYSQDKAIFKDCGNLDSLDLIILSPQLLGTLIIQNAGGTKPITYKLLLQQFESFKQSEIYKSTRSNPNSLTATNNTSKNKITRGNTYVFDLFSTIEDAQLKAKKENKKILLYFTGKYCVNARKMEENVLTNETIKTTLKSKFISFVLIVDDEISGEKNEKLQEQMFNANAQPFFVILDRTGKVLKKSSYTSQVSEFQDFLD